MFLRRIVDHMKQQHWTGVFIELVIVVLGVFIGLQVDNWNQARQEQQELSISLTNVAQEISNTAWHRQNQTQWMRHAVAGLRLALDALDGKELTEQQRQQAFDGLLAIPSLPPPPQRYETLYELQNTGLLSRVPSPALRAALEELLSQTKLATPFYDMFRRQLTAPDFSPDVVTYGLVEDKGKRDDGSYSIVDVDFDRARKDPMFRRRIVQGQAVFMRQAETMEASRKMDCLVLSMLEQQGYEPSGNWLLENMRRISPDARSVVKPADACKKATD